ncbi:Preprotein translocase subunit SecE [Frankia sp. AiPs1]|uniref:hypothetical protein n=1 Tax=Frankia sp. AiPa1 TaxID=573492 RepID=UPI00202B21D0|nr:hypothetical protein [Frankia sp. AiPa1]MCL9759308.1 hypothetical protein [Frankia sp. AiPa1]
MRIFFQAWWARYVLWAASRPDDAERDRGDTTQNVIWIAFFAALALTVIGIFGPKILDAAKSVAFK